MTSQEKEKYENEYEKKALLLGILCSILYICVGVITAGVVVIIILHPTSSLCASIIVTAECIALLLSIWCFALTKRLEIITTILDYNKPTTCYIPIWIDSDYHTTDKDMQIQVLQKQIQLLQYRNAILEQRLAESNKDVNNTIPPI